MTPDGLQLRAFTPGDESAILRLFTTCFGRPLEESWWRWRFDANPSGGGVIALAWDGSTLVGHYAVSSHELRHDGHTVRTGFSGTTMTHPEYRGRGIFRRLAEMVYERAREDAGIRMVWGFPNDASHRGFVQDLGWQDVHEIPTFRLDAERLSVLAAVPHGDVEEVTGFDAAFDDLWRETARRADAEGITRSVRTARQLAWRFGVASGERYRSLSIRRDGVLGGYATYRWHGSEMQVVDLGYGDVEVAMALLGRAAAMATRAQHSTVALWLRPSDPLHHELEKIGFRNGAHVTYLAARGLGPDAMSVPAYHRWCVAMSDSDVY